MIKKTKVTWLSSWTAQPIIIISYIHLNVLLLHFIQYATKMSICNQNRNANKSLFNWCYRLVHTFPNLKRYSTGHSQLSYRYVNTYQRAVKEIVVSSYSIAYGQVWKQNFHMKPFKAITIIFPLETREPKRKWTVEHNGSLVRDGQGLINKQPNDSKKRVHNIILNMFCDVYVYSEYKKR